LPVPLEGCWCGSRHPSKSSSPQTSAMTEGERHEASLERDGDCSRPRYCRTCLGANKRQPNDAIAQRAISDSGADGIDGLAYAKPSGKGASSSRNETRKRSLKRQRGEPTQRSASCRQPRRRDGRRASASTRWLKNRALRSAEPDLWHTWGGATICQLELSERPGTSICPRTISVISQPECSGTDAVVPSFGDELNSIGNDR
jgi:hypothetical protein